MPTCEIQCRISDGAVNMVFPDGAMLDLPMEQVARSKNLHALVSDADGCFTLVAPPEFVQR